MPFVALINDKFNDTPGTYPRDHVADTGETYWSTNPFGFNFVISGTGDTLLVGTQNGSMWQLNTSGGGIHNIGDEVWMDILRPDGPLSANIGMSLQFLNDGQSALTQWYECKVQYDVDVNNVRIRMKRQIVAVASQEDILPGTFPFPQTTQLRVGVTIKGDNEYDIWYEPFGGGTRTQFATWTPAPDANFTGWVGDNLHKWLGLTNQQTGFETVKSQIYEIALQRFISNVGPITGLDLAFSASDPVNDISFSGGAVTPSGILPLLEEKESFWWVKSSSSTDVREIVIYGKTLSGDIRRERLDLNGENYIIAKTRFSRILRTSLSQTSATDVVTLGRAVREGVKPAVLITLPINSISLAVPLKNSKSGLASIVRYEKLHFKNERTENFASLTALIEDSGSISGTIQIATEPTVNTTSQVENRLQPPSGITFADIGTPINLPSPLQPGEAATIWVRQTLSAEQAIALDDAVAIILVNGTAPSGPVGGAYAFLVEPAINIFKQEFSF